MVLSTIQNHVICEPTQSLHLYNDNSIVIPAMRALPMCAVLCRANQLGFKVTQPKAMLIPSQVKHHGMLSLDSSKGKQLVQCEPCNTAACRIDVTAERVMQREKDCTRFHESDMIKMAKAITKAVRWRLN